MKVGSIVRLDSNEYPQYRGMLGVLLDELEVDQWEVFIGGRNHPYRVHSAAIEIVEEK